MTMFPFSAIVGQEELKRALILHAIDPGIGGVVIFGDRGTGKSTAVRALARLLPSIRAVAGCRFRCDPDQPTEWCSECREKFNAATPPPTVECPIPVVDLPLGVSEDRLLGSLDIEAALAEARKVFSPGLLAEAHRGFLYIDEVNLLEDHLVDLLLDAAASGVNVVEREGISLQHPARFVLIGSGNPEEGDLRPQLRDRFALCVEVSTTEDIAVRTEIVRRRLSYEMDPEVFRRTWEAEERRLAQRIVRARERLRGIDHSDLALEAAARIAGQLKLQGHRGEMAALRSAAALAAWEGADRVSPEHVFQMALPAFRHRLPERRSPEAARDEVLFAIEQTKHAMMRLNFQGA